MGETELGVARVERVPKATGVGELAQGKALSMGQGPGSRVPYLGQQAEEEAAEQIEK